MQNLHTPKTVLWSSMGIEGRKQGDYFQTNPLARPKPASYTKKTAAQPSADSRIPIQRKR